MPTMTNTACTHDVIERSRLARFTLASVDRICCVHMRPLTGPKASLYEFAVAVPLIVAVPICDIDEVAKLSLFFLSSLPSVSHAPGGNGEVFWSGTQGGFPQVS